VRTLTGNFFLVPNRLFKFEELKNPNENGFDDELYTRRYRNFPGIEFQDNDLMVEFWAIGPECQNWHCHDWSELGEKELMGRLPQHIPLRVLQNLKEGDEIVLHFRANNAKEPYEYELKLRATQLEYRYARFGTFEETLAMLARRAEERAA